MGKNLDKNKTILVQDQAKRYSKATSKLILSYIIICVVLYLTEPL